LQLFFYKRAQIFVGDLYGAFAGQGLGHFHDINQLTMFAGRQTFGISSDGKSVAVCGTLGIPRQQCVCQQPCADAELLLVTFAQLQQQLPAWRSAHVRIVSQQLPLLLCFAVLALQTTACLWCCG
jgi:hypothetical protein